MICFGKTSKSKGVRKLSDLPVSQKTSPRESIGKDAKHHVNVEKMVHWNKDQNLFEDANVVFSILCNMSVNELLKIRLVSKQWNSIACEVLREKLEGVIILQRGLDYYTKVMRTSLNIPVGRVFLNILDMDEPQPYNFFRQIGHSVYYLILNLEGHSATQFQTSLPFLKNLKQLTINLFNQYENWALKPELMDSNRNSPGIHILVEQYDDNNNAPLATTLPNLESIIMSCEPNWKINQPILLQQLLKAAPNLKNLNLDKWHFPLEYDVFDKPSLDHLTFLRIGSIGGPTLKSLAQKRLHLKSAEFLLEYDVAAEELDMFLESVSRSLEYFRVESKFNKELPFRLKTKMSQLHILRLNHWVGPIWLDMVATNGEHLMKIQLSHCNPSKITLKHPKANVNVKYLAVNFGHFSTVSPKLRSEVVKHFIHSFPEVESFMMRQVSDKALGQIVNGWTKLKTLRITSTFGLTDSGLTGIPIAELSKMTKLENKVSCGCCLPVPVVDSRPCVDNIRQYPHIGKLTNLTELSIESEEGSHLLVTNFSLHLGVHELMNLHSLKLTCHNELGPHWCLKSIADNLPNLQELTVMDRAISHDRYEEHEVLQLLKRLPNLKLHFIPTTVDQQLAKGL